MRLLVLGSADAFNSAGRGHSCYLLPDAGRAAIAVDFGGTALAALKRLGHGPRALGAVVFTHLHGDHVGGFPFLVVDAAHDAPVRTAPLHVVGPRGARERLLALLRVAYGALVDRPAPFPLEWSELAPGEARDVLGARVAGFAADHMDPPEVPLCLRVTGLDGRSIAFSGDTRLCPGLFEAASGADLLVAECSGLAPPFGRHTTWEEWREALPRVGARRVLLTHLGRDVRARVPDLLRQAPAGVSLAFAEDGLQLDV